MGISVFLPQWNLATWMELKIRFTENPWNRALSEDEQKEENMMIPKRWVPQESTRITPQGDWKPSFPALKLTLESKLLGIYEWKKGKGNHLFCPCCKTCPTHVGAEQHRLQKCPTWHSQTLAWWLGLSKWNRKEFRNLIIVCTGFVPLSDDVV